MDKTLSQSVEVLFCLLRGGPRLGQRELDQKVIAYLRRTGTPSPSAGMVTTLADAVDARLDEEELAAGEVLS